MLSETGLRLFEHPLEVTDAGAFVFSWSVCPLGVGHLAGLILMNHHLTGQHIVLEYRTREAWLSGRRAVLLPPGQMEDAGCFFRIL